MLKRTVQRRSDWGLALVAGMWAWGFVSPAAAEVPEPAPASEAVQGAGSKGGSPKADPFLLELREGDSAFLARDYESAAKHYAAAITERPREAVAHFRLGETLRAQGKFDEALEALGNAARFAKRLELKARAVFVMADTYERATRLPRANDEWGVYLTIAEEHASKVGSNPNVSADDPIHPETAKERMKQIKAAIERYEAYAAVKERIEKRERELDEKAKGPAKKK